MARAKWTPLNYAKTYAYAREGMSNEAIASALGVSSVSFAAWLRTKPELKATLDMGRGIATDADGPADFTSYVYAKLSPDMQDLWDQLQLVVDEPNSKERIEMLLANRGRAARQHMFVHALVRGLWNPSVAMRQTNTTKAMLKHWTQADPGFAEILDEIQWHKQNWYISHFDMRVAAGDTPAILHAVKTACADRGYNDKLVVEHTGTVQHSHNTTLDLASLDLPVEVQRQVLDAVKVQALKLEGAAI